jgi:hypothetical protein
MLDVETRVLPGEVVERFPVGTGGIIQQNHHGAAQRALVGSTRPKMPPDRMVRTYPGAKMGV